MNRFTQPSNPPTKRKPFSWSYSRLKNYENCPHKYNQVDLLKNFSEDESAAVIEGKEVHEAMAKAVIGASPLPPALSHHQKWIDQIADGRGEVLVEQQLAINEHHLKAPWFKRNPGESEPWFRGVIDVLKLVDTGIHWKNGLTAQIALACDWKTGKVLEDCVQLALFAHLIFTHYPRVLKVRTEYVWLGDDFSTREDFKREDMPALWDAINPRVQQMLNSYTTGIYPQKKCGLCRRHCVVNTCPYYGK